MTPGDSYVQVYHDPEPGSPQASDSSIDPDGLGWALAAVAGALAGVLIAPSVFLGPNTFDPILISGFVAAVLGGLDSPPGAVVGGVLLGLALSYVSGYEGEALVPLAALVILVVVLMVRPTGLFSATQERRV